MQLERWKDELSSAIATALKQFRTKVSGPIQMFSVDCHPWNGVIALAILTSSEFANDPLLADAAEIAAWTHYNFAESLPSGKAISNLAANMRRIYESSGDKKISTIQFLERCAQAVASQAVQNEISNFDLAKKFEITITDPDSGTEYYLRK